MQMLKNGLIRYRHAGVMIEFDAEIMNPGGHSNHTHRRKLSSPLTTPRKPPAETNNKFQITNMEEFRDNFNSIVERYIHEHSEYSINISYGTRRQFISLMNQMSKGNESTSRITQLLNGTLNALKKKLTTQHSSGMDRPKLKTRGKRVMSNTETRTTGMTGLDGGEKEGGVAVTVNTTGGMV